MAMLFDQYLASSGKDGPDALILINATGGDRDQLERDLIEYLEPDAAFAADALRQMKSTVALPQLKAALTSKDLSTRVHVARAIWEVENDERWLVILTDALQNEVKWYSLVDMTALVCGVKHRLVFEALEVLMFHSDFIVRSCAARYYSENSVRKTSDLTIRNNLQRYDADRIRKFINKMRTKVDA